MKFWIALKNKASNEISDRASSKVLNKASNKASNKILREALHYSDEKIADELDLSIDEVRNFS